MTGVWTNYNIALQHVSHDTTETPLIWTQVTNSILYDNNHYTKKNQTPVLKRFPKS